MFRNACIIGITALLFNQYIWTEERPIVTFTKRILLEDYYDAYNPSIIKIDQGFLLCFRYLGDRNNRPSLSYIGVVLLNENFDPISEPQLLNTRSWNSKTPSQSEDARLFFYRGRIFLIYNDNLEVTEPGYSDRRDMFIAELTLSDHQFTISSPLKLCYEKNYNSRLWEKNWIPFEWNNTLMITYMLNPHEVIYPNLYNGTCYFCYKTDAQLDWSWGPIRGSTPPLFIDGEHLAFFHSGVWTSSPASWDLNMWHYYMGAYTFSAEPPFHLTRISHSPIFAEGFYTQSYYNKRIIFPGGVVQGSEGSLYVVYGKDDCEMWVAGIDKEALMNSLVPVNPPQ